MTDPVPAPAAPAATPAPAPAEAAPAPAPTPPASTGDADLADFGNMVSDVFGADRDTLSGSNPFEQDTSATPVEAASVGADGGEGEGTGSVQPSSEPQPKPSPTPEPAPSAVPVQPAPQAQPTTGDVQPVAASEEALKAASKDAQLATLQAEVEALRKASSTAPAPQETPKPAEAQQGEQPYNVQLPPALVEAIGNVDDPQAQSQGIHTLVNGMLTTMRQEFQKEIATFKQNFSTEIEAKTQTAQVQARQQQEVATMQEQYFQKFPTHKGDKMAPIVSQVASQLAAEYPGADWDDNYVNALGARVNQFLQTLGVPTAAPAVPAVPQPTMPTVPAAMVPTATRATTPTGELSFADESQQVLGFG